MAEPNKAGYPKVQGRCPACRMTTLFLGGDGYVTCGLLTCDNPLAASAVLGVDFPPLKRTAVPLEGVASAMRQEREADR